MGAGSSHGYLPEGKKPKLSVHFIWKNGERAGEKDTMSSRLDNPSDLGYLISTIGDKRVMKNNDLGIEADLYYNFRPPATFDTLLDPILKNSLNGLYVSELVINGEFADDVTLEERAAFWKHVQLAVTHLGLKVRKSAHIINGLDKTGNTGWSSLKQITTDKLVFE